MSTSSDLAVVEHDQQHALSMVDGPDPMAAMAYAESVSKAIASVLKEGNGYVNIQGRKHVEAAGWQTIAAMTGHTCEIEWSRIVEGLEHPSGLHSWEARAVVRDQHGRVVATGESMAAAAEGDPVGNKKGAPWARAEFSIRSMAQTRAMGRALASRMRYVVQLAGFAGVAAEEMTDAQREQQEREAARRRFKLLRDEVIKDESVLMKALGNDGPNLSDDLFFATFAHGLGYSQGKAAAEAVEGEVLDDGDEQQTLADEPRREDVA